MIGSNFRLQRSIPVLALLVASAAMLAAQDASQAASQQNPYQGVSHPPADDTIITTSIPEAKPPAGQPLNAPPAPPAGTQPAPPAYVDPAAANAPTSGQQHEPQPAPVDAAANYPAPEAVDGTDDGIVRVAPSGPPDRPALNQREYAYDPDGDIVHPHPLRPGELQAGTSIRVHLIGRLSTVETEKGEQFRTRVASDVLQGGQVVIPAGAEIDGRVVEVSSGHAGGHGSMRLEPEAVILPNGERFRLHADVAGTPGSRTHVAGEGTIVPDSRAERDGVEYGGAVGTGVVAGAIVGGPVGALTGGLIGAGAITVHLLVSHPQATLEPGTTLIFMLTDPLYLSRTVDSGN
jgi:type IV secretory pathway VirB10-like protein